MEASFKALKNRFSLAPFPSAHDRKAELKRLQHCLRDNANKIAIAIDEDFLTRRHQETHILELFPALEATRYAYKKVNAWMKPKRRCMGKWFIGTGAKLLPQPKGVVGVMVPWNYPLLLAIQPIVDAVAAGNYVLVKFSEKTPRLAQLMIKLFEQYQLNQVLAIDGDVAVAKKFSTLPFDHLCFTGSTSVGRLVMKAQSEHLTPLTLELGGKSPVIISYNSRQAYWLRIFLGKWLNAGQTCVAPDYVFVPEQDKNAFINAAKAFVDSRLSVKQWEHYSGLIDADAITRAQSLVNDAKMKGATVLQLSDKGASDIHFPPTLLLNVTPEMKVMQEELFCPILPIKTYHDFNEVMTYINKRELPLAIYYFGENRKEIDILAHHTRSGSLTINDTLVQAGSDKLPFGGVGASGMGHYHGYDGFRTFSHFKPVVKQRRLSPLALLSPPYGRLYRLLTRFIMRVKSD